MMPPRTPPKLKLPIEALEPDGSWWDEPAGFFTALPVVLWSALVLWLAWGWYVVPLGVPPASYRHVLGLDLTLALARMRVGERDEPRKAWAGAALTIGVFLVMLWLAHFGVRS